MKLDVRRKAGVDVTRNSQRKNIAGSEKKNALEETNEKTKG